MKDIDKVGKRISSLSGIISIDDISQSQEKLKLNIAIGSTVVNRARVSKIIEIKCLMTICLIFMPNSKFT